MTVGRSLRAGARSIRSIRSIRDSLRSSARIARTARAALLLALAFGPSLGCFSGCAIYRNDRCIVPEAQYDVARALFLETGSLDVVRMRLVEMQWRRCRVNEAVYRLEKEFQVPE